MPAQSYQQNGPHYEVPKAKRRVYINHNLFRDPFHRSSGFDTEKCKLCDCVFENAAEREIHLSTESHKIRETYHQSRKDFLHVLNGVKFHVAGNNDDEMGRMNITVRENERKSFDLVVSNSLETPLQIRKIFKVCRLEDIMVPQTEKDLQMLVLPNSHVDISMTAEIKSLGAYIIPLVFKIQTEGEDDFKLLLKEVIFRSQTELMDMLAPISPYKALLPNIVKEMEEPIIPYDRKGKGGGRPPLKNYNIPNRLKYLVMKVKICEKNNSLPAQEKKEWDEALALIKGPLSVENYAKRFELLLHFEELQMQYEMLKYGQNGETLEKTRQGLYDLVVPGLAEKRPSVLKGDYVYVRIQAHNKFRYEGFVKEVHLETVTLDFSHKFKEIYKKGMVVDVRFSVNRLPLKYYHRAVELINKSKATGIMFPSTNESFPTRQRTLKPWIFKKMKDNLQQQQAVQQIVNKSAMPAPYLVFGPPGTGKTVTLIEAIAQVWLCNQSNPEKQLVCAPTNSTADLLTVGLLKAIPKAKIIRIYAMSFDLNQLNPEVPEKATNIRNREVIYPSKDDVRQNHIVITTLVTAGRLVGMGTEFSYVYVDECGQALEPEALIPVAGILTTVEKIGGVSGQLVLAGDPKQLGPIVQSRLVKSALELSFLERLMETNQLYKRDPTTGKYNKKYLTKLVQNFRSHEDILNVPNRMFYENELETKGNDAVIKKFIGWNHLPNRKFPVIFHGIEGIDERECSSPSYFNRQEIDQTIKYIKYLLNNGVNGSKIKEDDIGVISPYSKQVQKFNKAFRQLNMMNVKVGTVEKFQGDEKLVIIISTVRSSQELVDYDFHFKLGFLKNPKRFNVAVTRAKALLILVGNPHILSCDSNWQQFMNYIRDNNGTRGVQWVNRPV